MVRRKIQLVAVLLTAGFLSSAAQAQLLGAPANGKFGYDLSLGESSFNINDTASSQDTDSAALTHFGVRLGGAAGGKDGRKFTIDGGFNYATGPNVSLLRIDQDFWLSPAPFVRVGFGWLLMNLDMQNDPYGFRKLIGAQIGTAYVGDTLVMAYKVGPVVNTGTANPTNLCHNLILGFLMNKDPKKPLMLFLEGVLVNFTEPNGTVTHLSDYAIGASFGFF